MKTCSKCSKLQDLNEFAFVNKKQNKRHCQCNSCRRETARKSYLKNRDSVVAKTVDRNKQTRLWIQDIKQHLSCCVCGEADPACLDFHHIDQSDKEFEISFALSKKGRAGILSEMNKCACLCANCHRKHHAGRLNASLVKLDITQRYER